MTHTKILQDIASLHNSASMIQLKNFEETRLFYSPACSNLTFPMPKSTLKHI